MNTKVQKSYEIDNDLVVFHSDLDIMEAKLEEVAEKLGEVIIKYGRFHRFETFEVETQHAGTFEQSKWLEVDIDEVEESVMNSTSMLIPEEKEILTSLLMNQFNGLDAWQYQSEEAIERIANKLGLDKLKEEIRLAKI